MVKNDGLINTYQISTPYGPVDVESTAALMIRINELKVMHIMEEMDRKKIFGDSVIAAMKLHKEGDPQSTPSNEFVRRFSIRDEKIVAHPEGDQTKNKLQVIGPVWQWVRTIYNNDTTAAPKDPEKYTIRLKPDGGISVKADCSMKGVSDSLNEGKLEIKILYSTMAMCEAGSLEDQFVKDLTAGGTILLNNANLYIGLKNDKETMRFKVLKQEE